MAGAFAQGFQLGGSLYNDAERMRLMQAAEDRAAQAFEWQRAEAAERERERRDRAETGQMFALASSPTGKAGTGEALSDVTDRLSGFGPGARQELIDALQKLEPEQAQQALRAYSGQYQTAVPMTRDMTTTDGKGGAPAESTAAIARPGLQNAYMYRDDQGGLRVTNEGNARSPEETLARFQQLAKQSGNLSAIDRAQAMRLSDIQARSGEQQLKIGEVNLETLLNDKKFTDKFNKYRDDFQNQTAEQLTEFQSIAANQGASGLINKYGKAYAQETGNTASLVGNTVQIKSSEGKVLETFPTSQLPSKLEPLLEHRRGQQFIDGMVSKGMFRNQKDALAYYNGERNYRLQQRQVGAAETTANAAATTADATAAYRRAMEPVLAAQADAYKAHGALYGAQGALFNAQAADAEALNKAIRPLTEQFETLTPEKQQGPEGQNLLRRIATIRAVRSGNAGALLGRAEPTHTEITNFIKTMENADSLLPAPQGGFIPFNKLSPEQQYSIAYDALMRRGGNPDFKPKGEQPASQSALPVGRDNSAAATALGVTPQRAQALQSPSLAESSAELDMAMGKEMRAPLQAAVRQLTPDVISRMTPEEAMNALQQARSLKLNLSAEQMRLLSIQGGLRARLGAPLL